MAESTPAPAPSPLLVAITGGSASGKTMLAARLAARLSHLRPAVVHQDRYFRAWPPEEADRRTANAPEAVLWEALRADLAALAAGRRIGPPPRARPGDPEATGTEAGPVVLVEGHLLLWDAGVRELCGLKVYLDAPDEERVVRRLLRDAAHGADLERAAAWLRRDVLANHRRYTAPTRWWADLVLPADPVSPAAFESLAAAVEHLAAAPVPTAPPHPPGKGDSY